MSLLIVDGADNRSLGRLEHFDTGNLSGRKENAVTPGKAEHKKVALLSVRTQLVKLYRDYYTQQDTKNGLD